MSFKERRISGSETVGEVLQRARKELGRSVRQIAEETHISGKYIEALEQGRYQAMPGPVYIRQYVRELCRVVEIPYDRLSDQLEQELTVTHTKEVRLAPRATANRPLWIPSLFRIGLIGIVILVIGTYFTWQIVNFISPPELAVTEPSQDIVLDEQVTVVKGRTQPGAQVTINQDAAPVATDGSFAEQVALRPGLNRIEIEAKMKYSGTARIVRQIVVR